MAQELRYVFASLPQWRCVDAYDIEAMEQVLAKPSFFDGANKILVRCRDDPHIYFDRNLSADAIELAFGKHAQQSSLQRRRHVANFVKKKGAAIGLLESTDAARVGACKRTLLVPE